MINIAWPITGIIMIVIAKVFIDQNQIVDEKKINYPLELAFLVLASCIPIIYLVNAVSLSWYYVAPIVIGMVTSFIWTLYDIFLNKLLGFDIWFTGSKDGKTNTKINKFLSKFTLSQHIAIKIIPLFVFIIIYTLMYFN